MSRFKNRSAAAYDLAHILKKKKFENLLVLAIPRGGVVLGKILAEELHGELDVLLTRKLPAPGQPEYALGAVSEDGHVYLQEEYKSPHVDLKKYVQKETAVQMDLIRKRQILFRSGKPFPKVENRSVIVVDDGIATGSTMIAALQTLQMQTPRELIVAVPVAPRDCIATLKPFCTECICLISPEIFYAVGEFYDDFDQVTDEEVIQILQKKN